MVFKFLSLSYVVKGKGENIVCVISSLSDMNYTKMHFVSSITIHSFNHQRRLEAIFKIFSESFWGVFTTRAIHLITMKTNFQPVLPLKISSSRDALHTCHKNPSA